MMKSNWCFFPFMLFLATLVAGCDKGNEDTQLTYKIGILLPFTGAYASDWDKALSWAVENVNLAGGVAGRRIELVKKDIGSTEIRAAARELISDTAIRAVIGPLTSSEVFKVAPDFISSEKVLMAPVATAANISRAFAGHKYFWRLSEPDISQIKTLLLLAQSGGARSVGLITEESQYGQTFEDWFGYFSTELGLSVTGVTVIDPADTLAARKAWNDFAGTHPDAVISALNLPALNISLVNAFRENGRQIRLLFSDAACLPSLAASLGPLAENLEGTTITADPKSGFDVSFHARYGAYPEAFLGTLYDAVTLLSLALEASGGEGGEKLADALIRVVSGRSGTVGWERDELIDAIGMIRRGVYPDLNGASSSLDFDDEYFTDVTATTYGHWRVDAGHLVITDFYTSDGSGRVSSTSAAYRIMADKRQQFAETGIWPVLENRKDLYAFLMATSYGWENYRHQADVLHAYQLLKSNGMDDDHIVLVMADDIAGSSSNPLPGVVRNVPGGENLYRNVEVDYHLKDISSGKIEMILSGQVTAETPVVIPSTSADDVFIFTSGHGTPSGMVLSAEYSEMLTPVFWTALFNRMHEEKRYRLLFWAVESCYSGRIGESVSAPGVMLMTAANPYETSKSDYWDPELKSWLGNRFAYFINNTIETGPDIPFSQLYEKSFSYVNGSHVSLYNYENFGNIHKLNLKEFIQK